MKRTMKMKMDRVEDQEAVRLNDEDDDDHKYDDEEEEEEEEEE